MQGFLRWTEFSGGTASSDHLIAESGHNYLSVGAEIAFQLNYSALVRAMTSPFVAKVVKVQSDHIHVLASQVNPSQVTRIQNSLARGCVPNSQEVATSGSGYFPPFGSGVGQGENTPSSRRG